MLGAGAYYYFFIYQKPSFIPDITNSEDLVVEGKEIKVIENLKYFQQGNIYINDEAKLIIKNSQFMIGRGDVPTIHVYIVVGKNASLEIENSTIFQNIFPEVIDHPTHIVIRTNGNVKISGSETATHLLEINDGAQVKIINSTLVNKNPPGGLVQVASNTETEIVGSTIGALGLDVPADSHLNVSGIKSGVYLESWDVHNIIPEANYNLVLKKTRILKDEVGPGPYERGWLFFINSGAHVRIYDSELRKVFIDLVDEDVKFENLRIGRPSSLKYRDIELKDVTVKGQWSFTVTNSNLTISDSDYLFLQPGGWSSISLVDSQMVEFIPREFFGVIAFENGRWDIAGEIMGGLPYHSMKNNFTIKGSLKINPELRNNLQWKDAQVKREYELLVVDEGGDPIKGALVKINGKIFVSDNAGEVKFNLIFDESNYETPQKLEVSEGNDSIAQREIDFFTETPIVIVN